MVHPVVGNSAAGVPHPEDPTLKIPLVSVVGSNGQAASSNVVVDSTGKFSFDLNSLASAPTYNTDGKITTLTYGPDANGRSIRQTTTWQDDKWMGDSPWVLVP
ncbi:MULTISPECIES: hypothetical protein [unclassified Duganella]|uniref:hypothetical protein n=1 Tax=unclassified Duganella TaxID=2636909 RepID=UPI00088D5707|nr:MULTISPECIES: hypothetical protein [unclassified Duganella]SDH41128.1 YD repeat-containing protein [Duganella sp. OV458]SDK61087.1 YD repeat-containing protein [Duganella sp. OV510]